MSMSFSFKQTASLRQMYTLRYSFGDSSGDVPLFSLHKIRHQMKKRPLPNSDGRFIALLINLLTRANQQYRIDSGKEWNCLTFHNVEWALDKIDEALQSSGDKILQNLQEAKDSSLAEQLKVARQAEMLTIRSWFFDHFEEMRYNLDGKVPWPVVLKLQNNLRLWAAGTSNLFSQDIEEMVLEVAAAQGISTDDPGTAWIKMGGKLFRSTEDD